MRRRRPARSTLVLRWAAVLGLLAIALAYVHPVRAYLHARDVVAARRVEVSKLEREKRALEGRLARASTDAFVLRQARRLGLVRPGERLYIVRGAKRAGLR